VRGSATALARPALARAGGPGRATAASGAASCGVANQRAQASDRSEDTAVGAATYLASMDPRPGVLRSARALR
jgi:hypothetical protein